METTELETLFFENADMWDEWLAKHVDRQEGVLLKFAKKSSGITSLDYAGALDVALCYGWIDGQSKSIDDTYYLQKFTPRRPRSLWSRRNIEKVEALIKAGRMKAPGFAAIEAAKADGRWEAAYASPKNATVPIELEAALDANPKAKAFFETLNKTNRYAVIWRIATARTEKTRIARTEKLIAMLEAGETFH
ncbi:YdeI/OmpD-associated family protein [Streptomyces caniscabiei]|uniref:YdeI/OmpD-associated family protein n=1 Tax=Streptomyces caniscabiei TaxID=2746961 RepID=UPI0029A54506|nr:YdeI/OmpD-associated family protein [Streptomyces caniscabiei]MDX2775971.1 YdeI/OmpD-associated family protein [Streptomyces caniscabiei]